MRHSSICFWKPRLQLPLKRHRLRHEHTTALVGEQFEYAVQRGDSLTRISARFGIEVSALARMNGINKDALLQLDQLLQVDNRHIIPE